LNVVDAKCFDPAILLRAGTGKSANNNRRKTGRLDWKADVNKVRMEGALKAWSKLSPAQLALTSTTKHAKKHSVPGSTFRDRLAQTNPMAVPSLGRPQLLDTDAKQAVVDSVRRCDQLNAGLDTASILDMLEEAFPHLNRKQLGNAWHHCLKDDPHLTNRIKSQEFSGKRTQALSEMSIRMWFHVRDQLRARHIQQAGDGLYKGKSYTEWMPYFIWGCDEECVLASTSSDKVIGDANKSLHYRTNQDCRKSGTRLASGNAAGDEDVKGPSWYILEGQNVYDHLSQEWLEANGAPKGSILASNSSAYMTIETFGKDAERFYAQVRNGSEVTSNNPHWPIEMQIDGAAGKLFSDVGMRAADRFNISVIKMQSHSSSLCQVFFGLTF
jgi:hypothetical protein